MVSGLRQRELLEHEALLLRGVRLGDLRAARQALEQLVADTLPAAAAPGAVRTRLLEVLVLLSRAAIDAGAEMARVLALNEGYLHELMRLESAAEMYHLLRRALIDYMAGARPAAFQGTRRAVARAVAFVKAHYHQEELTLERVARAVHLSPAYLSHVFSREMGMTLTQFVTRLRIEAAKGLLATTDLTLTDVAARVGYADASYFCKLFKRYTQLSPGAYRRRAGEMALPGAAHG